MKKRKSESDEIQAELKANRKKRSDQVSDEVQIALERYHEPFESRVAEGLTRVGDKCIDDVVEQYEAVLTLQETRESLPDTYVDAEVARLLRMLEKRKQFFEAMEARATMNPELIQLLSSCGVLFSDGNHRTSDYGLAS